MTTTELPHFTSPLVGEVDERGLTRVRREGREDAAPYELTPLPIPPPQEGREQQAEAFR
jgi:hypothetical protein